jgi:hypothetical protein
MIFYAFLKNSKRFLFPHRLYLLIAYNGKPGSPLVASDVDFNASTGGVMDISGFIGGVPVIKYPADFKFPLRRDEGRILENL